MSTMKQLLKWPEGMDRHLLEANNRGALIQALKNPPFRWWRNPLQLALPFPNLWTIQIVNDSMRPEGYLVGVDKDRLRS